MPNRKKWIRYVLYAVEILLLFLLQDTPGLLPQQGPQLGVSIMAPRSINSAAIPSWIIER